MRKIVLAALLLLACEGKIESHTRIDSKPSEPEKPVEIPFVQRSQPAIKKFVAQLGLDGEPSCYERQFDDKSGKSTIHCSIVEKKVDKRLLHEFECNEDGCQYNSSKEF